MVIKLYQTPHCGFCRLVRNKLDELKLEYEIININPFLRPKIVHDTGGTIPVIDDDGHVLGESGEIIWYLEQKYESKKK